MRIGSLFSGAGGLDLAVEQVFGAETAWHSEVDPAASKVLAHRWPGVPNLGDITKVDWAAVEPVDILCGGWPCQPFSLAGQRKGADDERALWPYVARAVRMVRPRIVVLENVSAVLGPEFQRVANDLAACGYDIAWRCLRASDVGAPHRRERLFVLAHAGGAAVGQSAGSASSEEARPRASHRFGDHRGERTTRNGWPTPHSPRDGWHEGRPESARLVRGSDAAVGGAGPVELLPTPTSRDGKGANQRGDDTCLTGALLPTPRSSRGASTTETSYALGGTRSDDDRTQGEVLLPTPNASDGSGGGQHPDKRAGHSRQLVDYVLLLQTPSTADGDGGHLNRSGSRKGEPLLPGQAREMATSWGKYEPAIRRWENLTRPAPPPTEPNTKGNPRLAAAFSEWLMGWPAGWVTDVPGISRNDALRIVGNGVVPQQAIAALRWLLTVSEQAA